jgi:hypothetical protein
VGGLSLEEYSKGLVGFSSLVEKGFPGYFLCTCAWCFFLLSWLLQQIVYGVTAIVYGSSKMLKLE